LAGQELHLPAPTGSAVVKAVRYYSFSGNTVAERTAGAAISVCWILSDRQGSNTIAVDSSSGNSSVTRYLPFGGNRQSGSTAFPTDRGWLGQTQDLESGLDYLNARYYDPILTRFISPDPLDDTATPQRSNPYSYGADNPLSYSDPNGQYVVRPGDNWYTIAALQGIQNPSANNWSAVRAVFGPTLNALAIGQYVRVPAIDEPRYNAAANFIVDAIKSMMADPIFKDIKNDLAKGTLGALLGLGLWAGKVAPNQPWDFKNDIKNILNRIPAQKGELPFYTRYNQTVQLYFNIWANISYGYVGRAAGFSSDVLQIGASLNAEHDHTDTEGNRVGRQIGIDLYAHHPNGVTFADVDREIALHLNDMKGQPEEQTFPYGTRNNGTVPPPYLPNDSRN